MGGLHPCGAPTGKFSRSSATLVMTLVLPPPPPAPRSGAGAFVAILFFCLFICGALIAILFFCLFVRGALVAILFFCLFVCGALEFVCATPRADSFEISSISKICFVHINSRFCAFCCGFRCSSFTPRAKKRETQKKATRSRIAVSFSSLHPGPPTSYHACVALSVSENV